MDLKILQDTPPWDWPRDAGKKFLKVLTDTKANESDRLIAADLAGNFCVINDDLAKALLATVGNGDEPEALRAQAAISLGPALEQAYIDEFEDPDDVPITEPVFHQIQDTLRKVYLDTAVPKFVRRRILEASVRAPEDWHTLAIRTAYGSGDSEWMLTAVFAMRWVRGFDEQIMEALNSADPKIHYEAVEAADNWSLAAAWPHVVALLHDPATPRLLLLAAISAVGSIRPQEAVEVLQDFADSDDEDIAEAANDAMAMADLDEDDEDEEDEEDDEEGKGEWVN